MSKGNLKFRCVGSRYPKKSDHKKIITRAFKMKDVSCANFNKFSCMRTPTQGNLFKCDVLKDKTYSLKIFQKIKYHMISTKCSLFWN